MKKVKNIDIVFENCESVALTPDMFCGLEIKGVTKEYCVNCFQYEKGEVNEFKKCEYFGIRINQKGKKVQTSGSEMSLVKRVKLSNDITNIEINFTDGTSDYISVPWGEDEYNNSKQKTKFTEDEIEITIEEQINQLSRDTER
jgi:hypothetical protein